MRGASGAIAKYCQSYDMKPAYASSPSKRQIDVLHSRLGAFLMIDAGMLIPVENTSEQPRVRHRCLSKTEFSSCNIGLQHSGILRKLQTDHVKLDTEAGIHPKNWSKSRSCKLAVPFEKVQVSGRRVG